MSSSNYLTLEDCTLLRVSAKAIEIEYKGERLWLPFSQLAEDEEEKCRELLEDECPCHGVTISATEWICREKGIDPDE